MESLRPLASYRLSCANIVQWSEQRFEIFIDDGYVIDRKASDELARMFDGLCHSPFDLLICADRRYSYSDEGAKTVGRHRLQRRTAIYTSNAPTPENIIDSIAINRRQFPYKVIRFFDSRAAALRWLEGERD
ncbi:hypothetical protein [uncultured Ferrimonas sp.]|uniref:hypothetical protein n=1 Tax=uncultured Ferrimonas sp. TaxID=432640 RepID=UPI0026297014|nr:hypothetical protein [uncultured Ferrimonas sp.]